MKGKYILLGLPPGGLFLARQLRKAYPDARIFAVGDPKRDIGRFSNTIDVFWEVTNEEELLGVIQRACAEMGDGKPKAFFCSNPMLEMIIGRYPQVFDYLEFENDYETYRVIIDKNSAYRLCESLGIRMPKEFSLNAVDPNEVSLPVVIKPLSKSVTSGLSKCAYLKTKNDYSAYLQRVSQLGIEKNNLICQQFIEGDNRWEYGYGGYFEKGKPIIDICFHQSIQVPQGLCCYSSEVTDNDLESSIKSLVFPFLERTHYTGMLEFDIKQDANSNLLYLLDINPRPWRSSDMLSAKLENSTIFNPVSNEKKVIWRYLYRELFAGKNANNPSRSVCRLFTQDHKTVTQYMLSDRHDRKPAIMQNIEDILDFFKRIKR